MPIPSQPIIFQNRSRVSTTIGCWMFPMYLESVCSFLISRMFYPFYVQVKPYVSMNSAHIAPLQESIECGILACVDVPFFFLKCPTKSICRICTPTIHLAPASISQAKLNYFLIPYRRLPRKSHSALTSGGIPETWQSLSDRQRRAC